MNRSFKFTIAASVLLVVVGCAPSTSHLNGAPASGSGSLNADQYTAKNGTFVPAAKASAPAPTIDENAPSANDQSAPEVSENVPSDVKEVEQMGGTVIRRERIAIGETPHASLKSTPACVKRAIATLKKYSSSGYRTYQRLVNKSIFETFVGDCSNDEYFYFIDLPTAVHESNHMIRSETNAYHLVSDEMLNVPDATGFFPPMQMDNALVAHLKVKDDFYNTYLDPKTDASSKDDFTYLLDELTAYTIDTQTSNDMAKVRPLTQRQAGLPALMTFVSFYATYAHAKHADVWSKMNQGEMRSALGKIWTQAEKSLNEACRLEAGSSGDDTYYIKHLCDAKSMGSLASILGRQPICPSACQ